MSEHGSVSNKLVDDIRLRSILWVLVMPNVLGRVKDLESKSIQEFSLGQQTTDRLESPACFTLKELRDIIKLWNGFSSESFDIRLHLYHDRKSLFTSIFVKEFPELRVYESPDPDLVLVVLHSGDFCIPYIVCESYIGYFFPSLSINRIPETWMLRVPDICFT
jgi:hypothetical protein